MQARDFYKKINAFNLFPLFLEVFGLHFREKCAVFMGFYKGFVASRNSPPFPADPPFPTSGQAVGFS